ncbi:hypothetical protein NUU61_003739 [Penicillium alfredii]|uniref:Uncharacterized protein n=1 Tax=Penicillium alfredii TaxID=1506179 RepID=A0A9W9FJX0_9EURO|nr:uncharacterized protein NUU61_003739 [Penicillium alfredii]KAJ5101517.1 hypothetical protein NUU61_003739 [Penicillium alfredii]
MRVTTFLAWPVAAFALSISIVNAAPYYQSKRSLNPKKGLDKVFNDLGSPQLFERKLVPRKNDFYYPASISQKRTNNRNKVLLKELYRH